MSAGTYLALSSAARIIGYGTTPDTPDGMLAALETVRDEWKAKEDVRAFRAASKAYSESSRPRTLSGKSYAETVGVTANLKLFDALMDTKPTTPDAVRTIVADCMM